MKKTYTVPYLKWHFVTKSSVITTSTIGEGTDFESGEGWNAQSPSRVSTRNAYENQDN